MIKTLRQRNFALLWFAGLVSLSGDWMLRVALPIYVYQLTGSALATSTMLLAGMLPNLLFGSIAGVFVDRWDRRRTMIVCDVLLALGLLPLLAVRSVDQIWIVYVVAFFESSVAQFFDPAENALLPKLVDEEYLVPANSLNALNNSLARLFGPAIGGLVAGLMGLHAVALLDAGSFLIAGALIALIAGRFKPVRSEVAEAPETVGGAWRTVFHEWIDGLQIIRRERVVAVIFALIAISSLGEGVFGVMFVLFVNKLLNGGATEIGWLMSAQAVGGLIGATLVGWLARNVAPARLIGFGSILFGLIDLVIFNYPLFFPGFLPIIALFVLVGIPGIASRTGINTVLQTAIPDEYRGRVFGAFGMVGALLALAGATLAGLIGDSVGVVTILNIQGAAYILAGLVVMALLGGAYSVVRARASSAIVE